MKNILLVYATREGQTEKIAAKIAGYLSDLDCSVDVLNAANSRQISSMDFDRYDQFVFGASMHAGGLEKELIAFIKNNKAPIAAIEKRSFFLVLLSAATKDPVLREKTLADARAKANEQLPVAFDDIEMIAGALTYSKYNFFVKRIMKRIAAKSGGDTDMSRDYEYTDWEQVKDYADMLAAL